MSPSPSRWIVLGVLLAGQFIANVDTAIINVALPAIGAGFRASGALLQLTATSYVIAQTALLVPCARLGKLYGVGPVFAWGVALFTAASLACGFAPGIVSLIAARTLQGAGAAAIVAQVLTGIQLHFEGALRRRALGWYTMTLSTSAITGQVLGGALVTADLFGSSWRSVFLINLPVGLAILVFAARAISGERARRAPAAIDGRGVALVTVALLALVVPLTVGRELGWPAWTGASLALAAAATAAAAWWELELERRGGEPIVRPSLWRDAVFTRGALALLVTRASYFALLFVLALYLQQALHRSALASGLALLPWIGGYGFGGPAFARFAGPNRQAAMRAARLGAALVAAAFALLALGAAERSDVLREIALACGGFSFGLMSSATTWTVTSAVPAAHASEASGVLAMAVPLAAVLGVTVFGGLYLALTAHHPAGAAFAAVAAALCIADLVAALALPRPRVE